LHNLSFS
jgi:hypothetical protein